MTAQAGHSSIDWNKGITVQPLLRHPHISTSFRWVHNLLETEASTLAQYNFQPKPAGWGNPGGGLEPDDFEKLAAISPEHYEALASDSSLTDDQRLIIAGGIRETIHETGMRGFKILTHYPGVFLHDYRYKDWVDKAGVVREGGHRKITLWGEMTSFVSREEDRLESHEVDMDDWFDMSVSLPKIFSNRFTHPDRPYWSHVWSTLVCLIRVYRHLRSIDEFTENIPDKIHPFWWYIFQVGRGDPRFPFGGYRLSPAEWYSLFDTMRVQKMEYADNDFLVRFLGKNLEDARRKEEQELEGSVYSEPEQVVPQVTEAIEGSEDSEGIPVVEDMRTQEYEEYNEWAQEKQRKEDEAYARWLV